MFIPDNTGRLIAVGDIHGCAHILCTVLASIEPQPDDIFLFLGDFINRGPDSKGVVSRVLELATQSGVYSILGNHEEMLLGAYQGGKDDHNFWCKFGGDTTLASYGVNTAREIPGEHLRFFANCADHAESEEFIFVHAGCDPDIMLENNNGDTLRWTKFPKEPKIHNSGKTVICGHTVQKQILDLGHICCIDTGCGVWPGGRLTAIDLKTGKIWQAGGRSKKATIKQRG